MSKVERKGERSYVKSIESGYGLCKALFITGTRGAVVALGAQQSQKRYHGVPATLSPRAVPLHIVADANIPYAGEAFSGLGEVHSVPGHKIDSGVVNGADVLLVRSVTRVDEALLRGSAVRFVGSATIGTDHVDRAYLRAHDIAFAHAPGSNAQSVVEYVFAALLAVVAAEDRPPRKRTVGVVGCGHIGGRLAARLPALGVRVLRCDPPLADAAEAAGARVLFESHLGAVADLLAEHVEAGDLVLVTGAGDVTRVGPALLDRLRTRRA